MVPKVWRAVIHVKGQPAVCNHFERKQEAQDLATEVEPEIRFDQYKKLHPFDELTNRFNSERIVKTNTLFHMSAGIGHFKHQRGAFQELEVMAVYSSHLPLYRRALWKVLALLFNKLGASIHKKYKL